MSICICCTSFLQSLILNPGLSGITLYVLPASFKKQMNNKIDMWKK